MLPRGRKGLNFRKDRSHYFRRFVNQTFWRFRVTRPVVFLFYFLANDFVLSFLEANAFISTLILSYNFLLSVQEG